MSSTSTPPAPAAPAPAAAQRDIIGGIYTDPFHSPTEASANIYGLKAPWLGGIRFCARITNTQEEQRQNKFLCIGCDDGVHFWTLHGEFTDSEESSSNNNNNSSSNNRSISNNTLTMDFTPKAPGVGLLNCTIQPGAIHFLENDGVTVGNTWSRLCATMINEGDENNNNDDFELSNQTTHDAFNNINGLYVDPDLRKKGSSSSSSSFFPFAGIRVVSDRLGKILRDEICVIGTDDGKEWWAVEGGSFTNKEKGEFAWGDGVTGTYYNGTMTFGGGKQWVKKIPVVSDFHSLPKEV